MDISNLAGHVPWAQTCRRRPGCSSETPWSLLPGERGSKQGNVPSYTGRWGGRWGWASGQAGFWRQLGAKPGRGAGRSFHAGQHMQRSWGRKAGGQTDSPQGQCPGVQQVRGDWPLGSEVVGEEAEPLGAHSSSPGWTAVRYGLGWGGGNVGRQVLACWTWAGEEERRGACGFVSQAEGRVDHPR